jgi:hypothetical protein
MAWTFGLPDDGVIVRAVRRWLPRMGLVGRLLCALVHTSEMLDLLLPDEFRNSEFRDVDLIGDCRDVMTDTLRRMSRIMFSNKLGRSGFRCTNVVYPYGGPFLVGEPTMARVSEIESMKMSRDRFKHFRKGKQALFDKGFNTLAGFMPNHNFIHIPAFAQTKKGIQFNPVEVNDSRRQAQFRWIIEAGYGFIRTWSSIDHVVPKHEFVYFDNSYYLAVGMSLFNKPMGTLSLLPLKPRTRIDAYVMAREATRA